MESGPERRSLVEILPYEAPMFYFYSEFDDFSADMRTRVFTPNLPSIMQPEEGIDDEVSTVSPFYHLGDDVQQVEELTSETCMMAISPATGPGSGFTEVTILVNHQIPWIPNFRCKFGATGLSTPAVRTYHDELTNYLGVVCLSPPQSSINRWSTEIHLSGDNGKTFSSSGPTFYYHSAIDGYESSQRIIESGGGMVKFEESKRIMNRKRNKLSQIK